MELANLFSRAAWITNSFPIIRIILLIIVGVLALALVVCVLFQKSTEDGGLGALGGQSQDTYYQKHKSKTLEGLLKRLTIIIGIAIGVASLLFFITIAIYAGPDAVVIPN